MMTAVEISRGKFFDALLFLTMLQKRCVFVELQISAASDGMRYAFHVDEEWTLVESDKGTVVHAYGSAAMIALQPGESTSALPEQMR